MLNPILLYKENMQFYFQLNITLFNFIILCYDIIVEQEEIFFGLKGYIIYSLIKCLQLLLSVIDSERIDLILQ